MHIEIAKNKSPYNWRFETLKHQRWLLLRLKGSQRPLWMLNLKIFDITVYFIHTLVHFKWFRVSAVEGVKKDNATGVLKKCKKFFEHQIQMVRTSTIIANIQGSFDHSLNSNFCEFQKDSVVSGCTEAVQKCQKTRKVCLCFNVK